MTTAADLTERPDADAWREVVTPEGVPIDVRLARIGARLMAVIVDLVLLAGVVTGIVLGATLGMGYLGLSEDALSWTTTIAIVVSFLLRTFYFALFELRWQGRTPGKRLLGIRAMDRRGAPLRPGAVFARNLTREVELFMPLSVLLASTSAPVDGWIKGAISVWLTLFLVLPLLNRDRLRLGDFVGGTVVIENPRAVLLDDMASNNDGAYRFSSRQLQAYGEHELQTLEQVLRLSGANAAATRKAVAERIRLRIGWDGPATSTGPEVRLFLEAYYAALRRHLEARMLFGRRRLHKEFQGSVPNTPRRRRRYPRH